MLGFFRKYQKFFFIFVTVILVVSFSFFGTFSTFLNQEEVADRDLGIAVDGSKITYLDIELMKRFLKDEYENWGKSVNLLCDSVIYKDFLLTDMGTMLAMRYFERIKPDLQERIRKAKFFTGYSHPQMPSLNAMSIWENFHPRMKILLDELRECDETNPTIQDFSLLCKLYVEQAKFPPHVLKQILLYHQNQYSWIRPDPALQRGQLLLFNFESLEDWFGSHFLEIASQFIINAARIAEQKGYHVTKEEARAELISNVHRFLQLENKNRQVSFQDAQKYYYGQLSYLGYDEPKAIKIWQKIAYFRRMFDEVGKGAFLDKLSLDQFHLFSKEIVNVEAYHLPQELHLSDFQSLLKLQLYLDAISLKDLKANPLDLLSSYLSAEMVEKQFPELVQKRFHVEIREVKKDQVALQATLKKTWDWELDETHFALLQKEFPVLFVKESKTREQRYKALEDVEDNIRMQIDQFARMKLLEQNPTLIQDALNQAELRNEVIAIKMKGEIAPLLEGIEDPLKLLKLLDENDPSLNSFSLDGNVYYQIKVLDKSKNKEILTFNEALKTRVLDDLLTQHLENAYPIVRKKNSSKFAKGDGTWKPFEEVKDQIGQILYQDTLKAIELEIGEKENLSLNFYASHRFFRHVKLAKKALMENQQMSMWISEEEKSSAEFSSERSSLEKQWQLSKSAERFSRQDKQNLAMSQIFQLQIQEISKIFENTNGDISFYKVLEKTQDPTNDQELLEAQKAIALDAKKYLMKQILEEIFSKNAICNVE